MLLDFFKDDDLEVFCYRNYSHEKSVKVQNESEGVDIEIRIIPEGTLINHATFCKPWGY